MKSYDCDQGKYVSLSIGNLMRTLDESEGTEYSWPYARTILEIVKKYKEGEIYSDASPKEKRDVGLLEIACQEIIDEKLNWE